MTANDRDDAELIDAGDLIEAHLAGCAACAGELELARTSAAELEAQVRTLGGGGETARLNVPIHDLWPESLVLRGAGGTAVELPAAEGPPATLILNSELEPGQEVDRLELRDEAGRLLERLDGPTAGAAGSFTLSLADRLPSGRLQILLFAPGAG